MSVWSRIWNTLRGEGLNREIDEEFQSHLEEAMADGRDPEEAKRAFGPRIQMREKVLDISLIPWLESIGADAVFGWRQLHKNKVTSAAAILSLALAIGACTSAFRLVDALLLRPLPVSEPERLHVVAFPNKAPGGYSTGYDSCSYPMFERLRDAVRTQAELVAVSFIDRPDITFGSEQETE